MTRAISHHIETRQGVRNAGRGRRAGEEGNVDERKRRDGEESVTHLVTIILLKEGERMSFRADTTSPHGSSPCTRLTTVPRTIHK